MVDECEGRLSELLIDSATDESEANSLIKTSPQEGKDEVVYLYRTRKGTMRSKMMIDKVNDIKRKLGSKVTLRKAGKTKLDSEISIKADYQMPGTDRILTDVAMEPPNLMAGVKSASYKTKRSDSTLTGPTLEMEILSQCGESTLKEFKPFREQWKEKRR